MTERGPVPDVGVYKRIAPERYHGWDAASSSRLSKMLQSPAHMKAYLDAQNPDTPALRIGRAIHVAILEPADFEIRYKRGPEGDRRTKAVREAWDQLADDYPDVEILRPDEWDLCAGCRASAWSTETAARLLEGPGDVELSVVYDDADTGVRVKTRWDRHSPEIEGGAIVDLKTTVDASPRSFERSIFNFNYHAQAALYVDSAAAHDAPVRHYAIIAVEKSPPYGVAVYRLTEGAIEAGRDQVKPLLALYGECQRTGFFPGYPDTVRDVSLPDWAWRAVEERVAEIEGMAA